MKKKLMLSLLLTLIAGLGAKSVLASASQGCGGIVAVMVAIIGQDNKSSKNDSTKAPSLSTLKAEFAVLNNQPENFKLIQQSAGGSVNLKALLN